MKNRQLILHIDMKAAVWRRDALSNVLREAADDGYGAVLWEVEDKVRWDCCPEAAHQEAMSKAEFREVLDEAKSLGLEPIPLLQTVGHAEYILSKDRFSPFREARDCRAAYCISRHDVRDFLKRHIAEMLDLFGSEVRQFHLGADEAWILGTCKVCSKHNRGALYAEHLEELAEALRARGIRPACWCDMMLKPDMSVTLKKDWVIWHWDYAIGTKGADASQERPGLAKLLDRGHQVIFACASQSYGDGPFLVDWNRHALNIAASVNQVLEHNLAGLCVTSWSVRGAPKSVQRPLFSYAARLLRDCGASPTPLWKSTVNEFFGPDADAVMELGVYASEFLFFDARDVKRHFDPKASAAIAPAPSRELAEKARAHIARLATARVRIESNAGNASNPNLQSVLRGAELTESWLKTLEDYNNGLSFSLPRPEEIAAFYEEEESPGSAGISASIVTARFQGDGAITVKCTRPSHRFSVDERAEFAISAPEDGTIVRVNFSRGYLAPYETFIVKTPALVSSTLNEPGFIVCKAEVQLPSGEFGTTVSAGAGFDPDRIRTALPPPADYNDFWESAFAEQAAIEPDFTDDDIGDGIRLISCRTVWNTRMYGWLRIPGGAGPFALQVKVGGGDSLMCKDYILSIADNPEWQNKAFLFLHLPAWKPTETGEEGLAVNEKWLAEIGAQGQSLIYWNCDKGPRQRWYYRCILGCCRLIEYAATRPEVDQERVYYIGASTGGGYGVFLAAFSPYIKAAVCEVPNYGNASGPSAGRPSGEDDRGQYWQTSLYYDAAYCAPRITCPVFMSCGYIDNFCVPETIYCIYNALRCQKVMYDKTENGHGDKPTGYLEVRRAWLESTFGMKAEI